MTKDLQRRSLFREVNERIREVNDSFAIADAREQADVFCECGQQGCLQRVQVPPAAYEEVRLADGYFLVTPGHEEGERVVAEGSTYRVVTLQDTRDRPRGTTRLRVAPATVSQTPE